MSVLSYNLQCCQPQCVQCVNQTQCTQCDVNYFYNSTSNICQLMDPCSQSTCMECYNNNTQCSLCLGGYVHNTQTSQCLKCPSQCQTCTLNLTCTSCYLTFYLNTTSSTCVSCGQGLLFCAICAN